MDKAKYEYKNCEKYHLFAGPQMEMAPISNNSNWKLFLSAWSLQVFTIAILLVILTPDRDTCITVFNNAHDSPSSELIVAAQSGVIF